MKARNKAKKIVENYLGVYDKRTLTENEKGILVSVENMVVDLLEHDNDRPTESIVPKIAEEKKEQFNKMIRDYTNDLIFGKQTQIMTDMLNFTNKLWNFIYETNNN